MMVCKASYYASAAPLPPMLRLRHDFRCYRLFIAADAAFFSRHDAYDYAATLFFDLLRRCLPLLENRLSTTE